MYLDLEYQSIKITGQCDHKRRYTMAPMATRCHDTNYIDEQYSLYIQCPGPTILLIKDILDHDRDGRHQNFVQNDAKFGHFEDHQRGFYVITETL